MPTVIFEFQRERADGEWEALGIARTAGGEFDLDAAVQALQAVWDGPLPSGSYRVRAVEGDGRWHFGEVGRSGSFKQLDA
jgi:hypothetical protein